MSRSDGGSADLPWRAVGIVLFASVFAALGCGGNDGTGISRVGGGGGRAGGGGVGGAAGSGAGGGGGSSRYPVGDIITQKHLDKLDLLFMVDNSIFMADKQALLTEAIPDLVKRLVSPKCVDLMTHAPGPAAPADPSEPCPGNTVREFTPIKNIHIGVITSSLGDHGDHGTCEGKDGGTLADEAKDDHGHLIATRPRFLAEPAKPEYAGVAFQSPEPQGFLDFNPTTHADTQVDSFDTTFKMMVTASSEFGCGLEAQLESVYRFLVDPSPPSSIEKGPCAAGSTQQCAFPTGKDTELLAERAAFLRPDSAVTVVMVSDENDCSIRDERQFFYAATSPFKVLLPHGSAACATNPNDPCCYSCGGAPPPSCPKDPSCASPTSDAKDDQLNLRCFDEKRRFGLDFLYPTQRYVNALTKTQLCLSNADLGFDPANPSGTCRAADTNLVENPLFQDLTGTGAAPRDPNLVFLAGIVGVPWQDLQATQTPATQAVPSTAYPPNELHYLTAQQMADNKIWDRILGDPAPVPAGAPPELPTDGLMVEDRHPRQGKDVTGRAIGRPGTPVAENSPINGHDWWDTANDDLMYACIFPLKTHRDCIGAETLPPDFPTPPPGCDCGSSSNPADDNPLCEAPDGTYGNIQYFSKAYPGIRELSVLRGFGNNSIVASICPRNVTDSAAQDYGYRPAMDAIVDRLKEAFIGRCLPRKLTPDPSTGKIPCSIVEVTVPGTGDCSRDGRTTPSADVAAAAQAQLMENGICGSAGQPACASFTYCEISPLNSFSEDPSQACHRSGVVEPNAGWCYIDPEANAPDDPTLVAQCRPTERRIIRFVDPTNTTPAQGSQVLILCSAGQLTNAGGP